MEYKYIEPLTDQQQEDVLNAAERINGNGGRAIMALMMYAGLEQYAAIKITPHRIIDTGIGGAFPVTKSHAPFMLSIITKRMYQEAVKAWENINANDAREESYYESFSKLTGEQAKEMAFQSINAVRAVKDWKEARHILNMTALYDWTRKDNPIRDEYAKIYFSREYQEFIDHNITLMPDFKYNG